VIATDQPGPVVLNFNGIFHALLRHKLILIGSSVVFAAVGIALAFTMTPIYRSTTVLIPASDQSEMSGVLSSTLGSLGGLAGLAGVNLRATTVETEEAISVLRSRTFSDEVIEDLKLMPKFFESKWDSKQGAWHVPSDEQPTAAQAFKYFDRNVRSILQDKKTGMITLQIEWKDPVEAASWANELVTRLNAEMQRRAILRADRSIQFLMSELTKAEAMETRNAINRLIEAQINRRMVANVTDQFAFRIVDRAVAPDRDDPVRPQKPVLVLLAGFLGLFCGVVYVLLFRLPSGSDRSMST
jgi:uncharacterized protein involved in exopolysaccharide biosynthesis